MITLAEIQRAAKIIEPHVLRTPLVYSPTFSQMTGSEVYLKLENLQRGGSFKVRGATYKILSCRSQLGPGVVAASVGNHAQGVALAARAAGVQATIVMPVWASLAKQEASRAYGAEVILKGQSLVESIGIAQEMAVQLGMAFLHPYDDAEIITGQGTIGLEILEDLPHADTILVPVGGGGLIGGISAAVKALCPQARIVGVQAASCPSAFEALRAGRPVTVEKKSSIADAIMVTRVGEAAFALLKDKVDEVVLVEEDQIAAAVLLLLERKKVLAEGAGAVPLAALLGGRVKLQKGSRAVLVISGGNVDSLLLDRILRQGLLHNGRIMRFSLELEDVPGSLARLLDLVARMNANVVHIHHARSERGLSVSSARIELELETRGLDHITKVAVALRQAGYEIGLK
jgi:threonine dehydratase